LRKKREIEEYLNSSMSSASASHEGRSADVARLREFRKMVNSKKQPQTVIYLRRGVYFVTLIIISIMVINIVFKLNFFNTWT
jgi:hypothetical protein